MILLLDLLTQVPTAWKGSMSRMNIAEESNDSQQIG